MRIRLLAAAGMIAGGMVPAAAQTHDVTVTRSIGADGTRIETTTRVLDMTATGAGARSMTRGPSSGPGDTTRWPTLTSVVPEDRAAGDVRRVEAAPLPPLARGNATRTRADSGAAAAPAGAGAASWDAPLTQERAADAGTDAPATAPDDRERSPGLAPRRSAVTTVIRPNPTGRDALLGNTPRDEPIHGVR